MNKSVFISISAVLLLLLLFLVDVILGQVHIPLSEVFSVLLGGEAETEMHKVIILEARMPQAITAMIAGVGLGLSGLIMQTFFRNPLAGPSVLGITSGSSLGVGLAILASGMIGFSMISPSFIVLAALIGALFSLFLILVVSRILRNATSLLIFGLMLGYVTGAIVSTLQYGAQSEALKVFVHWGLGAFSTTRLDDLGLLAGGVFVGVILMIYCLPTLNVLLMGDEFAKGLGVRVTRVRRMLLLSAGIMTATITAFCGPIAFLGLAVPHLVRGIWRTSDHKMLIPGVVVIGGALGILSDVISRMPWSDWSLPVNTVTSMIGAPIVIFLLLRQRKKGVLI